MAKGVTVLTSHRHTTCMAAVVYVGLPPPLFPLHAIHSPRSASSETIPETAA